MKMTDIRCNLARLRISRGHTQGALVFTVNEYLEHDGAICTKLDRVSISKAECGSVILIPDHVAAIAAYLDCTPHDIYPGLYPEDGDPHAE